MKESKVIILFFLLLILPFVSSSIIINEVELNPPGSDSGNEWVELYSNTEINLTGYFLQNNDGGIINLTGTINGYLVYTFPGQWLDNSDEKVSLYQDTSLIHETPILEDSKDNSFAFSYCANNFIFIESSKNTTNICPVTTPPINNTNTTSTNFTNTTFSSVDDEVVNSSSDEEISNSETNSSNSEFNANSRDYVPTQISLNAKTIKTDENSELKDKDNSKYGIYGLITFCILLLFLFLLRKQRYRKNEFNQDK